MEPRHISELLPEAAERLDKALRQAATSTLPETGGHRPTPPRRSAPSHPFVDERSRETSR